MQNKGRLLFREHDHHYIYQEEGREERYTSVTTLLNGLHQKKDISKMAKDYLLKHGNILAILKDVSAKQKISLSEVSDLWGSLPDTVDSVLKIWKDINKISTDRGSSYHLKKELEAYNEGGKPVINEGEFKIGYGLKDLEGFYPELMVYHPFYKICGTIDKAYIKDKRFKLGDFKTNKKGLERKGFKGQRLLTPISHLEDCNYWVYVLQLSLYAFILEEWGYICDGLEIIIVKDVEKDISVTESIPYLKQEAKSILTYFKERNYLM